MSIREIDRLKVIDEVHQGKLLQRQAGEQGILRRGFFKNALSAFYVGRPNELIVRQLDENRMLYRCVAETKLALLV